jgi:predicted TPR repeat methyltransferase
LKNVVHVVSFTLRLLSPADQVEPDRFGQLSRFISLRYNGRQGVIAQRALPTAQPGFHRWRNTSDALSALSMEESDMSGANRHPTGAAALHDAYAGTYDAEVRAYDCHIADLLFGLTFEYVRPGQRLLDAGAGTGLCGGLFARAGLVVHAMDFAPAMLAICRAKGFAADLTLHDVQDTPWPYHGVRFDHVACCGVFHFLPDLDAIFAEVARLLPTGGAFAFTTRIAAQGGAESHPYACESAGDFTIFSHAAGYVESLLAGSRFARLKVQRCFVGADLFRLWVAEKADGMARRLFT